MLCHCTVKDVGIIFAPLYKTSDDDDYTHTHSVLAAGLDVKGSSEYRCSCVSGSCEGGRRRAL